MADAAQDRLTGLNHLIAVLDERRVEGMLRIAFLMADDADTAEAEKGLREIEAALVTMRGQRVIQRQSPAHCPKRPAVAQVRQLADCAL